jgi:uncharacterized membrane protein
LDFDPWVTAVGLALSLAGAGTIVRYTSANRRAREKSARSHWKVGWILGAAGMTAMGSGWALLCLARPRVTWAFLRVPGAVLCLAAAVVYAASARRVGRWRAPSHYSLQLFTGGIYARVRHPQALSLCLLAAGIGLLTGSIPYLMTLPIWIAFWTGYTYLEERNELIPVFGEAYLRYAERTPRIWPRLRP